MMLEQRYNPLPAVGYFTNGGIGATGLTVLVDVWAWPNGTQLVNGAAATEIGGGNYGYVLSSSLVTTEALYIFKFRTTGEADQPQVEGCWAVNKAGIEYLSGSNISLTVIAPVAVGGDVDIIQGDAYTAALERALEWETSDADQWPDLTTATNPTFYAKNLVTGEVFSKAGTIPTPSGANKRVRVELTSTESATLADKYRIWFQVTLATEIVTLLDAQMNVKRDERVIG
jgi:hypothetical protein